MGPGAWIAILTCLGIAAYPFAMNRRNKLAEAQVREIREFLAAGTVTQVELGERFGVTKQAINQIALGINWKAIGGPPAPPRPRTNTGYWGVTANGAGNRFTVTLHYDGVIYRLGTYRDAETAARAFDAKARELGFPPERLNFPDEA
jgi:hypothetical protein